MECVTIVWLTQTGELECKAGLRIQAPQRRIDVVPSGLVYTINFLVANCLDGKNLGREKMQMLSASSFIHA